MDAQACGFSNGIKFQNEVVCYDCGPSQKNVSSIIRKVSVIADKEEMDLKDLVCKIKQGLSEFCDFYPKIFGGNNLSLISECLRQATDPNSKKKKCNWF